MVGTEAKSMRLTPIRQRLPSISPRTCAMPGTDTARWPNVQHGSRRLAALSGCAKPR
jgi:hypothetical protein